MNPETVKKFMANEAEAKQLLGAHLGSRNKADVFYKAMRRCVVNGEVRKTVWSWWGFASTAFYFMYRKMYRRGWWILALCIALLFTPPGVDTWVGLAVSVCCGMLAFPAYFRKFFRDLEISKYGKAPILDVTISMEELGGSNIWAILGAVVYNILLLLYIINSIPIPTEIWEMY